MKRVVLKVLTLLGAGTATLVVTACYGPIPENYRSVDVDEVAEDAACIDSTGVDAPQENIVSE